MTTINLHDETKRELLKLMGDSTQTIFHTAKRFFSATVLSRISGMLRDMAMAFVFGTQGPIAAFMLAFRFSHLLRRLFGEGAMQSAFIPEFEEIRHNNSTKAFEFFRDLYAVLTLFLLTLVIVGVAALGVVLAYVDLSAGNRQIIVLTMLMLPSLLFICLYGLNASLLQCEKSYFTPGVAPVAFNAVWIVVVLLLKDFPIDNAMLWLSGGVIVACFAQWLVTVSGAWAIFKQNLAKTSWFTFRLRSPELALLGKGLFLAIIGVAATQINSAVDSVFARYAEAEGPAFLWYALRIQQLPLALFGIAISSALLPPLARAIKKNDQASYHHFIQYALSRTFALMLPITVATMLMGDAIINLIYGRGDFDQLSVANTTRCLWGYTLGLLPTSLVLLLAPAFYAQSRYFYPVCGSILCMVSNCLLNAWFINAFGWGATSVAVATSISAWGNMAFLGWGLWKQQGSFISKSLLFNISKVSLTCLITGTAFYICRIYFFQDLTIDRLVNGEAIQLPRDFISQSLSFAQQGVAFGVFYLIASYLCGAFPVASPRLDSVETNA